jgi:cysteine desulfurase
VIYLDFNATTPVLPAVFEAMKPYFSDQWGNPSSSYRFGASLKKGLEVARSQVSNLIGVSAEEILFTAGATEANNTAIRAALNTAPKKRHIITSQIEHSSVLELCLDLERQDFKVTYLPVNSEGLIDLVALEEAITLDTAVVSLMWANNETGVLFPVDAIAEICQRKGVLFHCDAVQAAGKVPVDLSLLPIDFLSISAHKIYGPKGVGALFVRAGAPFHPLIHGGNQEAGRRGGTENVALIAGLGVAAALASEQLESRARDVRLLRDLLEVLIKQEIPTARIYGANTCRIPNTSNIGFHGIDSDSMVAFLDSREICVSSGSACMSGALGPSHVILSMTGSHERAKQAVRFSLSHISTHADVVATVAAVKEGYGLLRS